MHPLARSTVHVALAAAVVLTAVVATAQPARAGDSATVAEDRLLSLINRDRAAAGLVAVRTDNRLRAIARMRSADMASKGYFSHEQPDGRNVFDLIEASGITWYGAGEILAWNTYPDLLDSGTAADSQWLGSAGHRAIIVSTDYNYAAFGVAIGADGRAIWTGVFMKGPDRTRPTAAAAGLARRTSTSVRFAWRGSDVRLQTLTAGLRDFQVQRRVAGGAWSWVTTSTTSTARTVSVSRGRQYEFRVRSRDRAGNVSAWTKPVAITT